MLVYVFCGFSTCKDFATVSVLCQYIKNQYPNFQYKKIVKSKPCYKSYIATICEKHGWKEFKGSPMIWKEVGHYSGHATLIGDENKFQELMTEIYGVETFVPCEEKAKLAKDEENFFVEQKRIENEATNKVRIRTKVCFLNAGHTGTRLLVTDILLRALEIYKKDGVEVRLVEEDEELHDQIQRCIDDVIFLNSETRSGEHIINMKSSIDEGIVNSDLIIIMPSGGRLLPNMEQENITNKSTKELESKIEAWKILATKLNTINNPCKILVFPDESLCFNLTCLAEFVHKVKAFDIVGVTEDLGMNILSEISKSTKIPKQDLHNIPPVWGFVGSQYTIDVCNMQYSYYRNMPDEKICIETRNLMAHHEKLNNICHQTFKKYETSFLNQVNATTDLINAWFSEKPNVRVFSAAVLSDGTFGIPGGLYFSQPVTCVNHEWIPYKEHPIPDAPLAISDLYKDILPILKKYKLGSKWNAPWIIDNEQYGYHISDILTIPKHEYDDNVKSDMSNGERFELKKQLGKRNQLYPPSYKKHNENIQSDYGDDVYKRGNEQTGTEKIDIMWDTKEHIENDPATSLDFLIDEFLMDLMVKYEKEDEDEPQEHGGVDEDERDV